MYRGLVRGKPANTSRTIPRRRLLLVLRLLPLPLVLVLGLGKLQMTENRASIKSTDLAELRPCLGLCNCTTAIQVTLSQNHEEHTCFVNRQKTLCAVDSLGLGT